MAQSEQELAAQRIGKGNKTKTKQAYYKLQREHAEESGDQSTTDKIYSKLGKKSHNVDSSRGDKAILGAAPFIPEAAAGLGEMAAARGASKLASMVPKAAEEAGEGVESAVSRLVPKRSTSGPPAKSYQHLGRATPVKKALPSSKGALGGSKGAPSIGSKTSGEALSASKGPKALTGGKQKAVSTSGHHDFNGELAKVSKAPVKSTVKAKAPKKYDIGESKAGSIKNPQLKKAIGDKIAGRAKSAPKPSTRAEEVKETSYRFDKAPKTKATKARNVNAPNKHRGRWSADKDTTKIKRKSDDS